MNSRHRDGSMANPTPSDYHRFLISDWTDTLFFEYRLNRILLAIAVSDRTDHGLSAVYTFFDPVITSYSIHYTKLYDVVRNLRLFVNAPVAVVVEPVAYLQPARRRGAHQPHPRIADQHASYNFV